MRTWCPAVWTRRCRTSSSSTWKRRNEPIDGLAAQIGLSRLETAEGMIRISCEATAQAVKGVVVARARDPRDFVLASFGGAGTMHACFVAQAMNIPRVVIPGQAGVASAFRATAMNVRHDLGRAPLRRSGFGRCGRAEPAI